MDKMTDSKALELLDREVARAGGVSYEDGRDLVAARAHIAARLREPAGVDLHDRVEFALRDAGFDYDVAARIASLAQQPASDGGFTAADMMDARQEGRKEGQQPAAVDEAKVSAALSRLARNEYGDPRTAAANRSRDIRAVRDALNPTAAQEGEP